MQRLANQRLHGPCWRTLLSATAVVTLASWCMPQSAGAEAPACDITYTDSDEALKHSNLLELQKTWVSDLRYFVYLPQSIRREGVQYIDDGKQRALVVALHGCGQAASIFDNETGWTKIADERDFILLLPSQKKAVGIFPGSALLFQRDLLALFMPANVSGGQFLGCFNFYQPTAIRDDGEPKQIMTAVAAVTKRFNIDPKQIYVTGLSGGAAMTLVMAANYPDCFDGAAPIAGLPYGCAKEAAYGFNAIEDCMDVDTSETMDPLKKRGPLARLVQRNPDLEQAKTWGDMVRDNARRVGVPEGTRWPRISAWAGTHDRVVAPDNMDVIAMQWSNLHGVAKATISENKATEGDYTIQYTAYVSDPNDPKGQPVVETRLISASPTDAEKPGNGHEVPISVKAGCGCPIQFIGDAGVCASDRIAEFWGLKAGKVTLADRPKSNAYCQPIAAARDDSLLDSIELKRPQ